MTSGLDKFSSLIFAIENPSSLASEAVYSEEQDAGDQAHPDGAPRILGWLP